MDLGLAALVVSVLALLFTIASFWWMNWRKGKLIVGLPSTYAASARDNLIHVQLPLVLYNDGAGTRVVQNLRLMLEQNDRRSPVLQFNNTLTRVASNEGRDWAHSFAIEGRKACTSVFVFQTKQGGFTFSAGKCEARLEAKLEHDEKWETLLAFELHTPESALEALNSGPLIAHDNTPDYAWDD